METVGVGWLAAIIIGGIAGWLAEMFMKSNMGVLMNIVLGTSEPPLQVPCSVCSASILADGLAISSLDSSGPAYSSRSCEQSDAKHRQAAQKAACFIAAAISTDALQGRS